MTQNVDLHANKWYCVTDCARRVSYVQKPEAVCDAKLTEWVEIGDNQQRDCARLLRTVHIDVVYLATRR